MSTDRIQIVVRTSPEYEVPQGIRAALEQLAEEIVAERSDSEVEGYAGTGELDPLAPYRHKFGSQESWTGICFGTFEVEDDDGRTAACNWVYVW